MGCFDDKKKKELMDNSSDTHVKLPRRLKNIYNLLSKKRVWISRYILIGIAMIYEMMPGMIYTVFPCLKKTVQIILEYEKGVLLPAQGDVVTITTVLWTFTTAISIYCIEKLDCRYYGISVKDIIFSKDKCKDIIFIVATIAMEPVFLFLSAIFDWVFVSILVGIFCFVSMLYALLIISNEMSSDAVEEKTRELLKDKDGIKTSFVSNFFKNANYADDYEASKLLEILLENYSDDNCEIKEGAYNITHYIISNNKNLSDKYLFIMNWITGLDDIKRRNGQILKNADKIEKNKQGIILAVIEKLEAENAHFVLEMLDISEQRTADLCLWCAACNIYFERFKKQGWRRQLSKRLLFNASHFRKPEKNRTLILDFKEVYELMQYKNNDKKNNYDYFTYIYRYCTNE